ncbi:hypothetical protein [Paramaledivibacter caminithermalis]|jgi:hypothetical protein|uniref:Uncharacterized protein n=1 Tax=Paramaledivibacter caminithermalis (strain DSM 15212 / CIP 107654 / DViRD3) TaxID=1121301 RepID=A0A1M6M0Y0_PARC5|nr:hypothetical protein [Paramaledivibacter caminithermalis]SHJ77088.1 hypothetical protein SAMN02745912_01019 [Paramaledivibacter caminithermalis DSM 15212]
MKKENKSINNKYYTGTLNSNINFNNKVKYNKNDKNIIEENTFESKKDHSNPSSWID